MKLRRSISKYPLPALVAPVIALVMAISNCGPANAAGEGLAVLTHADYQKATGCRVAIDVYERSVRQVIASVVFASEPVTDDDAFAEKTDTREYTIRHSRELFGPVFALKAQGSVCAHPTLVAMGEAAGYPEETSPSSTDAITEVEAPAPDGIRPYVLTSRSAYIKKTACVVSRSTYENLRAAFVSHVLYRNDEPADAVPYMRTFLQETGEGARTADGKLRRTCLTDTISRLASELGLLDANGDFTVE